MTWVRVSALAKTVCGGVGVMGQCVSLSWILVGRDSVAWVTMSALAGFLGDCSLG